MNKIKSIVSVLLVLVVVGLVWWSKSIEQPKVNSISADELTNSHPARTGDAILTASETFYDFGIISMKNGNVSGMFQVTNSTDQDIAVPSLTTSCMCTTAYILGVGGERSRPFGMPGHGGTVPKTNAAIKSGEAMDIEVVYDPNAHGPAGVGLIERFVFLEDENGKIIEFKIKVNVTP